MIDFACRCGFKYSLPDEMAGGAVQCPKCRLLLDVPGLGDLANLEPDGTVKVKESPQDQKAAEERFIRAYAEPVDEEGRVDRRPTMEDLMKAGTEEVPLELADEVRPGPPKYDPETGELISPMAMKPPPQTPDIPIAAVAPVLHYATDAEKPLTLLRIPLRLMTGGNIAAILMLLICHVFLSLFLFVTAAGMYFVVILPLFLLMMVISHYANAIEDFGPNEKDDIPTPARNLSWGEDLFWPFQRVIVAVLCAWPFLLPIMCFALDARGFWLLGHWPVLSFVPQQSIPSPREISAAWMVLPWALFIVGAPFFPALLLTTTAGGAAITNLRPDRVLGVMRACGARYVAAVLLGIVAVPVFWTGLWTTSIHAMGFSLLFNIPVAFPSHVAYPILFLGIYLMHLFCWHLGGCYRQYHEKFPWVLQIHHAKKIERRIPPKRPKRKPIVEQAGETGGAIEEPAPPQPRPAVEPIPLVDAGIPDGPIPLADESTPEGPIPLSEVERRSK